ncbi:DNA-binding protein [Providencia alcalifaciens]|uniref:YmfL family putative regulatory protein n=1 Tax=Providencia alcalifaciens TaxID=126385 RepID=UPI0015D08997|nr:YmfL family putative regulatory protein [Providencia alcalifaciens]MBF0690617.1 DNA-binding protein [Providencia alcalifaciens]NYS89121.1 DNA-binding protein [Providencia alcalifaciens]
MKQNWQAEKQPAWLVAAIRKTISSLPGGYDEAPEWLGKKDTDNPSGVTAQSLFNRLRTDGDQLFPFGWAMVLQQASGNHFIANAVAKASGGIFVPQPDIGDIDNEDINIRLMEALSAIGEYCECIKESIADGEVDDAEREKIEERLYLASLKLQEHASLVYRVFCRPEKVDAPDMRSEASGFAKNIVE